MDQFRAGLLGVTFPWTLIASSALGVFLMFSPIVLGAEGRIADSDHLMGALALTVAVIAMAEVARALRFINVLFGAWVAVSPFLLDGGGLADTAVRVLVGLGLVALSLPRGQRSGEHYGGWDRLIV